MPKRKPASSKTRSRIGKKLSGRRETRRAKKNPAQAQAQIKAQQILKDPVKHQEFIERHSAFMAEHPDVKSFGLAVGEKNGKLTNEIRVVVTVAKKKKTVSKDKMIPKTIEGIPTDVLEHSNSTTAKSRASAKRKKKLKQITKKGLEFIRRTLEFGLGLQEDWFEESMARVLDRPFDPLIGGISIRNPEFPDDAASLGGIVFDSDGKPHGITVHHGIAKSKAEIYQPFGEPEYKIGVETVADECHDMTLIRLNSKRKFLPRIIGEDSDIEPGVPIRPAVGWQVECLGRYNYAKGTVIGITEEYHRGLKKPFQIVHIAPNLRNPGSKDRRAATERYRTQGGDSGSLWVDVETKRPVGLHCGSLGGNTRDYASCMVDLAQQYEFGFSPPPKSRVIWKQLEHPNVQTLSTGKNLVAMCQGHQNIFGHQNFFDKSCTIKTFDQNFKLRDTMGLEGFSFTSGIAIAELRNDNPKHDAALAVWKNWNNRVQALQMKVSSNKTRVAQTQSVTVPSTYSTFFSPSATAYEEKIAIAFVDSSNNEIQIAMSDNGKNWTKSKTGLSTSMSPSITAFKDSIVVAWVDHKGQLKISEFEIKRGKPKLVATKGVTKRESRFRNNSKTKLFTGVTDISATTSKSPSVCANEEDIFLAYSIPNFGGVQILKGSAISKLVPYDELYLNHNHPKYPVSPITQTLAFDKSPTLTWFQGELICS